MPISFAAAKSFDRKAMLHQRLTPAQREPSDMTFRP